MEINFPSQILSLHKEKSMKTIPDIIGKNGLKNLGLLSVLYLSKPYDEFFAGIFELENRLFIVVKINNDIYAKLPVTEKDIEGILRGQLSLFKILKRFDTPELIFTNEHKDSIPSRIKLMFSTLVLEKANWIYTIPNAYYYWNEFYFSRQLAK